MGFTQFKNISTITVGFILFTVFTILSAGIILFDKQSGPSFLEINVGEPAPRDFFAPLSYEIIDPVRTKELRQSLAISAPLMLRVNREVIQQAREELEKINQRAHMLSSGKEEEVPRALLSDEAISVLIESPTWQEDLQRFQDLILATLHRGALSKETKDFLEIQSREFLILDSEGQETSLNPDDFVSVKEVTRNLAKEIQKNFEDKKRNQLIFLPLAEALIQPSLFYDEAASQERLERTLQEAEPVMEPVLRNQILLEKGKIVSEENYQKYQGAISELRSREAVSRTLGNSLLVFLTYVIFASYCFLFERRIFKDLKNLLLVHTVIFVILLLERIAFWFPENLIYLTLPVSLSTLLISTLVRSRVTLMVALVMILLTSIISEFRPDIILFATVGTLTGVFAAVGLRKRSQFLKVGLWVGVNNALALIGYWLLNNSSLQETLIYGGLGLANGLIVMLLFFFLVFCFERLFKVTTDLTLLELSDLNHPLLKKMVLEAPGTYHHTLMIANLCEAAAREVGANPLLARVGSYFHDIGKIAKAEYYTENASVAQIEAEGRITSPHEQISSEKSRDIIMAHVKDGIELGKKNKLPKIVLDFIPEHQGTCVIYYFYKKACEEAKAKGREVNPDDYRYPGPKPQSKETAIALLADSVEASSRSLSDHSQESIKKNLKKIINEKFIDGQLEECNLTLKDLEAIAESFSRTLIGVHHTRVRYPEREQEEGTPKPFAD